LTVFRIRNYLASPDLDLYFRVTDPDPVHFIITGRNTRKLFIS
jgi:hypothetical protein